MSTQKIFVSQYAPLYIVQVLYTFFHITTNNGNIQDGHSVPLIYYIFYHITYYIYNIFYEI